ncbi:DUF4169 family protein [Devosia sp.]|uniref:DUF4169 family protein n=1 Tax=Devosia sp. TaxID=1871048 RepID=UPI0035B0493C
MAEILSLSRARKAKARADKEQAAAENRIRFGRTKAERQREAALKALAEKRLDGDRRGD